MAEEEHCLHTGSCHCGQPQGKARTRVIPITPTSMVALPHCREAGFETMVTIPVQMQQRVLGEVDLFFRFPVALNDDLRELLEAMTRHLASAMEGLRATALEREAAVAQERSMIAPGAARLHRAVARLPQDPDPAAARCRGQGRRRQA